MTTTYDLLVNWLLRIGAIDQPGIDEVNEYEDPESYLCGTGFKHLEPWEQEALRIAYLFGPFPLSKAELSLIDKGYLLHDRGFVFPTASTCNFMELA